MPRKKRTLVRNVRRIGERVGELTGRPAGEFLRAGLPYHGIGFSAGGTKGREPHKCARAGCDQLTPAGTNAAFCSAACCAADRAERKAARGV